MAFQASLAAGGEGIFTGSGGPITTIADTSGPFSVITSPSINASGTVAFFASLDTGEDGIFTVGPDLLLDPVIRTGDPLFGATVTGLSSSTNQGLNDNGQVAFFAFLSDGTVGIFRADPVVSSVPEPGALWLIAPGLAGLVWRRRSG